MPLLGFTVFKKEVKLRKKRQTIRKPRKNPIKKGDALYLYWHLRRPDCELLRVAECKGVLRMTWADMVNNEELARMDGFSSIEEFSRILT